MWFSPRLDRRLVEVVFEADVERLSIAETWRWSASGRSDSRCVARDTTPCVSSWCGSESAGRRRAAIVDAIEELWSYTGTDYETLARRLADTRRR